jgi:hypothetical protein
VFFFGGNLMLALCLVDTTLGNIKCTVFGIDLMGFVDLIFICVILFYLKV